MKTTKAQVIARICKGGFNEKDAKRMVSKYWHLAEARGCESVKDFAEDITGFYAA